jgi:hypothetical protein
MTGRFYALTEAAGATVAQPAMVSAILPSTM